MTDATELDEAAIRARVEAATEGPWFVEPCGDFGAKTALIPDVLRERYGVNGLNCGEDFATAEFIAHARTDLPAALDEITRLRAALASIRTLARSWSGRHDLLMTGDSAAHDIEAALAAPTTTDEKQP